MFPLQLLTAWGRTLFAPEANDQLFVGDDCYVFSHVEDVRRTMEIFGKTHKKQDRIVMVGGGNVGLTVALQLEQLKTRVRVKVIEKNRKCAEMAAEALERTIVLNGDGLDAALLNEAGISRAERQSLANLLVRLQDNLQQSSPNPKEST